MSSIDIFTRSIVRCILIVFEDINHHIIDSIALGNTIGTTFDVLIFEVFLSNRWRQSYIFAAPNSVTRTVSVLLHRRNSLPG